ncbi:uncharacterized protein PGTG_00030 [Puccinia graminis f. sp. tritici CRL 75-36-700-3]|uniref:Ribosomal RNA-processing protein 44 n=1 Tax=Puccinia graminis f. sp. tritici (strain CRL 75-36-700-3 / race SCCL) TaxID=418459 RepID=E3JPZ1_PUCGT|nr:uncharacterized protein PGTG_00030 [Puccinia graminis f. sp. tritici CRL 75-36-700-3]EFP74074.2 hypothetical protein PGTG_00030 [Puccinia graminis f. sp. tritici CRL 75-36-700-3]
MAVQSHPPITILNLNRNSNEHHYGAEAVTQKQYLRKTNRGKVQKLCREHYLRNDIPCGSSYCSDCQRILSTIQLGHGQLHPQDGTDQADRMEIEESSESTKKRRKILLLSESGRTGHRKYTNKHYLVLDTNVVLRQIDLLEATSFGTDLIVPQTVLDEVRHRSLPIFNRLKSLINETDSTGRFIRGWIFWNESRFDTHVRREPEESINDRNDRAIREVCTWYKAHLGSHKIDVVLLTDDRANFDKATQQKIQASTTKEYVEHMAQESAQLLLDLVASTGSAFESDDPNNAQKEKIKSNFYQEYLPLGQIQSGIQSGHLFQGTFRPNPYNYLEGSIFHDNFEKPVLLIGRESMNRAIDGDVVAVELLPREEWKSSTDDVVVEQDVVGAAEDPDPESAGSSLEEETEQKESRTISKTSKKTGAGTTSQPTGRVVGVITRNWRPYVCHIDRASIPISALQSSLSAHAVFAMPLSRSVPKIRIRTRQASTLANQKILVSIDRWEPSSRYPEGHFVRALGIVESKDTEQESLLLEHDIPYRPFGKAILDCLPPAGDKWIVPEKNSSALWNDREDFRELMICSIDPPGCQDIDDALHARRLANGNIEVGVHIADVSHFVLPDTPMDVEAASRGTTVYLVDKRIDMLPSLLGTNLCSLKPEVERLAFSVIWELREEDSKIEAVRFTKSVIKSKAAFTYEAAQIRKDDSSLKDEISESIRLLNKLAIQLKKSRMDNGALNLASPEIKIHMSSSESSDPVDVEQKESRETNSLVEEFMLLANISVARRIYESFPQTAVLRRHNPPPKTNFEVLQDVLLKRRGLELDVSSSASLASSLDKCIDPDVPAFNTLVRIMATRCMLPAEYFGSGSVSKDTFGHYGLASEIYTHFTSPIRRYADVLVHRQLQAAITEAPLPTSMNSKSFVEKIMLNLNKRHNSAQKAGRASVEFYVAIAIKAKQQQQSSSTVPRTISDGDRPPTAFVSAEAFVIRTFRNGLAVFVSEYGLEGLIKFKEDQEYDGERYEIGVRRGSKAASSAKQGQEGDLGVVKIGIFDKVFVGISTEQDRSTQRGRVKMVLLKPVDSSDL